VRSQTPLLPSYVYGGIHVPIVVKSYLHRKKLPGRTNGRPALSLGVLRSVFAGQRPHLQGNCVSMWGRRHMQGRWERQSCPPFHLPLIGGLRSKTGLRPSPFRYPFSGELISLLSRLHFYAGGVSHLLPCGIHEQVGIPRLAVAARKTLWKTESIVKR
jgi:hypothetical protein